MLCHSLKTSVAIYFFICYCNLLDLSTILFKILLLIVINLFLFLIPARVLYRGTWCQASTIRCSMLPCSVETKTYLKKERYLKALLKDAVRSMLKLFLVNADYTNFNKKFWVCANKMNHEHLHNSLTMPLEILKALREALKHSQQSKCH